MAYKAILEQYSAIHVKHKHKHAFDACKHPMCRIMYHDMLQALWSKACEYDKVNPDSKFVVFSDNNPFTMKG